MLVTPFGRIPIPLPAILVLALGLVCTCGQGKKDAAASTASASQSTNSSAKVFKQNGLNDLEKSIFGPLRNLGDENSMDALTYRKLPPPVMQDKHTRESIERRKNWAFMTPEELVIGKSTMQAFDLEDTAKDSEESKLLTPMERYYQRFLNPDKSKSSNPKNGTDHSPFGSKDSLSPLAGPEEQDDSLSGLPPTVREAQRALRNAEKEKKAAASEHRNLGFFSDVFALERKPSLEEQKQDRERLEMYRKSLGLNPTPFGSPFDEKLNEIKDPYRVMPQSPLSSLMQIPTAALATPAGSTIPKPSLFSEPASKLAGSSSLSPAMPRIDPPKSVLPPNPTFAAPRRVF